jgi:transglutaminase-like putative cysteine protease
VAYAATQDKQATKAQPQKAGKQQPAEKLERFLDDLKADTSKAEGKAAKGEDTSSEVEAIKVRKAELDAIDTDLKKEFALTEQKLKAANLSKEILSRHYKFVKNYEDNLDDLKSDLDSVEKAKTPSALTAEIAKTQKHLAKIKPTKKRKPFDPNKLPNKARQTKYAAQEQKKPEENNIPPTQPLRKRSGLNPFNEQNTAQTRRPILIATNGPLDGLVSSSQSDDLSSHEQLANLTTDSVMMNSIIGYPTIITHPPASAADLAETPEIQFTPAILAKAQELEHKPVKIWQWVKNNIEFVPTYGAIQGADMCLQTKQCNDIDTASLLIALLRASNISARYVYGTLELPIEKAKNWLGGVTDPRTVGTILATNGIPGKLLISGGTITAVQFEHVWVNAWINYIPSRGAVHRFGHEDTWIPLDASYNQYNYTPGIDITTAVPFDAQSFANQIQSTATINQTDGSVTNVNSALIQQTMQSYQAQVQNYIQQNYPNATVGDVFGKKEIKQQHFPFFPGTLQYITLPGSTEFAQVPDNLKYKVSFEIQDSNAAAPTLSYTTGISELAGKRVTLSYIPATSNDEQVINSYGGIFNVPAYLVNMKPQIRIEGVVAATGNPIGLGNDQTFNMQFVSPAYGTEIVSNVVTAGAYYGIGINPSRVSQDLLSRRKTKLEAVKDTICVNNPYSDECGGELLYATAMAYFLELNSFEDIAAQSSNVVKAKDVSEAIASANVNVSNLFGVPTRVSETGIMIDVDRNIYVAMSKSGDPAQLRQFMILSGEMSSIMEHAIFEQLYGAKGVSTIQLLQAANNQGIPIYDISQNNISSVLPILQISNEIKTDIQNAVNAGKTVVIPKQNITYYSWSGTGYIVQDPVTGAGAYMISTNLAGGGQCVAAGGCTTQTFDGSGFAVAIGGLMGIAAAIEVFEAAFAALQAVIVLGGWALLAVPFLLITMIVIAYFAYIIWTEFIKPQLQAGRGLQRLIRYA